MQRPPRYPIIVGAVAVLALCGCTSQPPAPPHPSTTSSSSTDAPEQLPLADAIAKIMASSARLPVLGTSSGTLASGGTSSKVVAELLQIRATPNATLVIWRLKSGTGSSVPTTSFQFAHPPLMDTRLLGVVDTTTRTTYRPYTYVPIVGDGADNDCLCSTLPNSVDAKGQLLYALVPPLPTSVTKVDVTLPGLSTIASIDVDRPRT